MEPSAQTHGLEPSVSTRPIDAIEEASNISFEGSFPSLATQENVTEQAGRPSGVFSVVATLIGRVVEAGLLLGAVLFGLAGLLLIAGILGMKLGLTLSLGMGLLSEFLLVVFLPLNLIRWTWQAWRG